MVADNRLHHMIHFKMLDHSSLPLDLGLRILVYMKTNVIPLCCSSKSCVSTVCRLWADG